MAGERVVPYNRLAWDVYWKRKENGQRRGREWGREGYKEWSLGTRVAEGVGEVGKANLLKGNITNVHDGALSISI